MSDRKPPSGMELLMLIALCVVLYTALWFGKQALFG